MYTYICIYIYPIYLYIPIYILYIRIYIVCMPIHIGHIGIYIYIYKDTHKHIYPSYLSGLLGRLKHQVPAGIWQNTF